jgi:hypothetical protein
MHGRQRKYVFFCLELKQSTIKYRLTKRVEQLLTSGGVEGEPSTSSQQIRPRIQQRKRRRLTPTDEEEEWQVEDEAFEEESEGESLHLYTQRPLRK